jgi:predicted kinase
MKRRPIVYLICGFIGAGKTTFAKKLEEKTGAVRITKDEWSICLIGNDPTIDGYEEWDTKIIELSRDVAFQLAEKGIDVIIDEGFWAKEQRDELRRKIDAIGAKAVMYYVETPIETIRDRVVERNNNLTKDSFKISRELLDNYLKYWQPPSEDEDYILASERAATARCGSSEMIPREACTDSP